VCGLVVGVQKQVKNVQTNVNKTLSKVTDAVKNVAKKPESTKSGD
jgi:DNA anti-recombination protein RmuC